MQDKITKGEEGNGCKEDFGLLTWDRLSVCTAD